MKIRSIAVCHTCRARKVGCDRNQPFCSQCTSAGLKCGGYKHDFIFVSTESNNNRSTSPPQRPPKSKRGSPSRKSHGEKKAAAETAASKQVQRLSPSEITFPPSMTWPLNDVISLVVRNFSPTKNLSVSLSGEVGDDSPSRICGAWMEMLPQLSSCKVHASSLESSVKALAISILARESEGVAPMSDALAAHCSALRSLHSSLGNGDKTASNVLVACIMCLFVSELILPTSSTSSTAHADGLGVLIQMHSPDAYSSGLSHKLFAGARPTLIVHSIRTRKPTFLAKPEWVTEPFTLNPSTCLQDLCTLATVIPSILQDVEGLETGRLPPEYADGVLHTIVELFDNTQNWYRTNYGLAHNLPFWTTDPDAANPPLWFPNVSVADSMTHYWVLWIVCITNMRKLRFLFPELLGASIFIIGTKPPEDQLVTDTCVQMALWIFQSVEFLTQEEMKLYGPTALALPLTVAYRLMKSGLTSDGELMAWCESVVEGIGRKGYHHIVRMVYSDDEA